MFYFAHTDGVTPFGVEHHVYEEIIFSFEIAQEEDGFATLTVEMVNPGVGLLNEDRDQWVWFSEQDGMTVTPLFHGRIVGVPEDLNKKVITVVFTARPVDFVAQKEALADTLRVRPYWDPIFIDPDLRADPDTVLEAYCASWHIDRVTGAVSLSNRLAGSSTIALGPSDVFHDTTSVSYEAPPVEHIHLEATVSWDQFKQGFVDFSQTIIDEFGSGPYFISSYSEQGLVDDWPEFGDDIGGGWKVYDSKVSLATDVDHAHVFNALIDPSKATPDFEVKEWWEDSPQGYDYWYDLAYQDWLVKQMQDPTRAARFYRWDLKPTFTAFYSAGRTKKEVLTLDVYADVQPLVTDDGDPVSEDIKITATGLADPIDPGGALPIEKRHNGSFFNLDRGHQAIEYLLALARARILYSARAANVSFEVAYATAVDFSCDKDVLLTHPRLPGGQAGGKITSYAFGLKGDDGIRYGSVTIGCVIGKGNTLGSPSAGEPSYVEVGYVEDYQHYESASLQPIAGEITYNDPEYVPDDDGVDFDDLTAETALQSVASTALLTFVGPGSEGDTVTVGARTYTFTSALALPDDVLIGADYEASARNLAYAIVREEEWEGVLFAAGTEAHDQVEAQANDGIVRVTAYVAGPGADSISVSTTTSASWDTATLTGGHRGIAIYYPASAQESAMNSQTFGSVQEAIDYLKTIYTEIELSLVDLAGGPFETAITLTVSDLMVPKTIDLEADAV